MSQKHGVTVSGARELRRTLRKAGADMKELRTAHLEVAGIIIKSTRAPYRKGLLEASLRAGATQTTAIARAGNNRKGKTAVRYANPIHWGWRRRHIKPNPFLSLAAQRSEPRWFAAYARHIEQILSKIKGA